MSVNSLYRGLSLALLSLALGACATVRAAGESAAPAPGSGPAGVPAVIDAVNVEIGVGSPLPVMLVVDSSFPDECAQIVAVQQQVVDGEFQVTLTTDDATADCLSPMGPLPFRLLVPLNAVALEAGTHTVTVNDVSTTFEYPPAPGQ